MFRLVVVTKLDLTLVTSEIAGFVERDRVGSIQDVVTGLFGSHTHTSAVGVSKRNTRPLTRV